MTLMAIFIKTLTFNLLLLTSYIRRICACENIFYQKFVKEFNGVNLTANIQTTRMDVRSYVVDKGKTEYNELGWT